MNVNNIHPNLSGLEQLQAMLANGNGAPIGETLKFRLVEIDDGHAVFEAEPGPHAYNPIGSIHGGFAATLLDSACGCAVHSKLRADQIYTTLELKTAYHRGMTAETGTVRAAPPSRRRVLLMAMTDFWRPQRRPCSSWIANPEIWFLPGVESTHGEPTV